MTLSNPSPKPALYNERHNLIFFNIPKNAMSLVSSYFEGGCSWKPGTDIPTDAKVFCILRDPFDRWLSSYFHLCKIKACKQRPLPKDVRDEIFKLNVTSAGRHLDDIIEHGFFDGHHIPQRWHLGHWYNNNKAAGNINRQPRVVEDIDYFLDFSKLNKELSNLVGKDLKIPKLGARTNNSPSIIDYFKTRKADIMKLYNMDYQLVETYLK